MIRSLILAVLLVTLLPGCAMFRPRLKSADTLNAAVLDTQLLDAAHSIERTQAELRSIAVVSRPPAAPMPGRPEMRSQKPITIDWQGDAAELTHILATEQGLSFVKRGVSVPLPVTLRANHLPYQEVMDRLSAQLDYRASVYNLPGRLVLEYTPSTGVTR